MRSFTSGWDDLTTGLVVITTSGPRAGAEYPTLTAAGGGGGAGGEGLMDGPPDREALLLSSTSREVEDREEELLQPTVVAFTSVPGAEGVVTVTGGWPSLEEEEVDIGRGEAKNAEGTFFAAAAAAETTTVEASGTGLTVVLVLGMRVSDFSLVARVSGLCFDEDDRCNRLEFSKFSQEGSSFVSTW